MRQGWESEAVNWARFARTPGHDHAHEHINLPAFLQLLPPPGRRTLDLACGEGRLGRVLQAAGHTVVGIDTSPTLVRLAAAHPGRALAVLADATQLPFLAAQFDLAVAYMCLHDVDDMPGAIAEVARVLAPSGQLCMAIPHPVNSAGSFADRSPNAPFVITGSYLDSRSLRLTANRDGVSLIFHSEHRPLQVYAAALEAAGLLIARITETRVPDELAATDPAARRWQRVPLFLHLRAVKPG